MKKPHVYFRAYLAALLMLAAVPAEAADVKELFAIDLADYPGKEGRMIEVSYPPGARDMVHRHDAHAFVYVLEGQIVMQLKGKPAVTLKAGQTFYEGPTDVHLDVGVGTRLPALALEDPARLPAAAGVAAARDRVAELPVRILRILFEVPEALQASLIAQLDAAQIQHRVLHRHGHLLALAGLLTADQRGEDADQEMHAGIAVAERSSADRGRAVPETGRRGGAAGALRHVIVDADVLVRRARGEALNRPEDEPRIELLDALPGEPHPVHRTRPEVLDQDVGLPDQLLQDRLAFGRLGVDLERPFVAVQLREIQRVRIGDVAQLTACEVSNAQPLDFQDVGPEPCHHLATRGARLHAGEVDNLDTFLWQRHHQNLLT